MNLKNKKGVTMMILVVTIIIMSILFSVTVSTSVRLLKNSQRKKMKTMLFMVKSRAEILLDDYLFENDGKDLATIMITDIQKTLGGIYITDVSDLRDVGYEFDSEDIPPRNHVIYCAWEEKDLQKQGIDTKNLAKGDRIIVRYDVAGNSVDVASTKGFASGGVSIHSLTDF